MTTAAHVSPEQASAEVLRRQRARASLVEYARSIDIPGVPVSDDPEEEMFEPVETAVALHHRLTMEAIQRTMEKKRGRLMIFEPPGSAKSTYGSVVAPVWAMSKWKGHRVILASYGLELAERHSRRARALARDPRQQAIWESKPTLSGDQKAISDWSLTNGSNYMAAGFQTGITGNRADGVIIDDPVKGREAADSETIRNKTKEEFRESIKTRLKPNGYIILIQTRWHQDDLAGSILPEDYKGESGEILCRDGQVWEVLNIPAKCEHEDDPLGREIGQYLWLEYFSVAHWQEFENDPQGKRTWSALYQQRPTAGDGVQFKREMFRRYDPDIAPGLPGGLPLGVRANAASDVATKDEAEQGHKDFTEHCIGGLDSVSDLYILDWWYGQKATDVWIEAAIALMRRWKPLYWAHEGGPIDNAVKPAWARAMREAKPTPVYTIFQPMPSIKNKVIKLSTLEAWVNTGRVWLPLNRPWADRVIDQLVNFPAGKYDDAADAIGLLARLLDKMLSGTLQSKKPRPQGPKPFTGEWLEYDEKPTAKLRFR